ncbi:hypothetical protein ACS0TY_034627 [Phlomoides rotata]
MVKGCLGALDGTYIDLHIPSCDKPRFRTRKGHISTNVLGVCDRSMRFVYVLPRWEGSAADYMVLRDAIIRPNSYKPKLLNGVAHIYEKVYRGIPYHNNLMKPRMNDAS